MSWDSGGFGGGGGGGGGGGRAGGYQGSFAGHDTAGAPTSATPASASAPGADEWDGLVRRVGTGVRALAAAVGEVERLTAQLGTGADGQPLREQLHGALARARQGSAATGQLIHALDAAMKRDPHARRAAGQKLVKDFTDWLHRFREVAQLSAQTERRVPLPSAASPASPSGAAAGGMGGGMGGGGGYGGQSFMDAGSDDAGRGLLDAEEEERRLQVQQASDFNAALIAERDQGIREIQRTVEDVNEIFRDLGNLVEEQGSMIDNIESNIEETTAQVDEGVVQLRKASDHQKSARSKACWLALCILITAGIAVGIVIFFVAGGAKK